MVADLTIEHIADWCCVCFVSHKMDCKMETDLSPSTTARLAKQDKSSQHLFAQVFKATGKNNPDIWSCEEVQRDCSNLKEWLAAALKEIRRLRKKGMWTKCSAKLEANGKKIIPCTQAFQHKCNPARDIIKHKARSCVRGVLMIDDADSHAPEVQWITV